MEDFWREVPQKSCALGAKAQPNEALPAATVWFDLKIYNALRGVALIFY